MAIFDFLKRRPPAAPPSVSMSDPAWVKADVLGTDTVRPSGMSGLIRGARLPKRGTVELLAAYQSMPYLRSTVGKIAKNAAGIPVGLYARTGRGGKGFVEDKTAKRMTHEFKKRRLKTLKAAQELREIQDHPFLSLIHRPRPDDKTFSANTLMFLTFAWLLLVGDAFWVYNTNAAGMPVEIFAIPPHWVREIPTRERPFFVVRIDSHSYEIPVSNMLWFKDPSLENPYGRGAGTGHALADELDVDENASKHVSSFFYNRTMPDMIVSVEGADEDALLATKAKFEQNHAGFTNQYRSAFLSGKVGVERLDTSFKDMNLIEVRKHSGRDVVIHAFGLSPEMLGILDNSNRATISEARAMFAENVLVPLLDLVSTTLQAFAELFDERLIVAFDDPRPDDLEFTLKAAQAHQHSMSENEWRALQGQEPVEGGDVYFVDPTKVPLRKLDEQILANEEAANAALAAGATGGAVQDSALNGAQITSLVEILTAVAMGVLPKPTARAAILAAFPGIDESEVDDMLAPIVEGSVKPPPPPGKPGGGPPPSDSGTEPAKAFVELERAARVRTKASEEEMENVLEALRPERLTIEAYPLAEETISSIGVAEAAAVGAPGTFNMLNPLIVEYLEGFSTTKIVGLVNETTREALRLTLIEGVRNGEDIAALAGRVEATFTDADNRRALVIARTEVVGMSNRAIYGAHVMSGVVQSRQWVPTPDGRSRDTHKPSSKLAGQVRAIGEKFESGSGAKTLHPGGFGRADEDIQCRCTTIAIVDDQPKSALDLEISQRDFEARIAPHEDRMVRALQAGFRKQRADVLAALRALESAA